VARRAFACGSNANATFDLLKYARIDAERIAATLQIARYGFVVHRPEVADDRYDLRKELDEVAFGCAEDDVFVCYFSGHGFLEGGELQLVLDRSQADRRETLFPASWLVETLKHCRARNRLLILDCCHAGAATGTKSGAGLPVEELVPERNELILCASRRLEQAREFEELKGSFLAHGICSFLEAERAEPTTLKRLMGFLESGAVAYNAGKPKPKDRVPVPFLYGLQQGDFTFDLVAAPGGPAVVSSGGPAPVSHLGRTAAEWERDLLSEKGAQRREAAWALGQLGQAARPALLALLRALDGDGPHKDFVDAVARIAPHDNRILLPLIALLETTDEPAKASAIDLLAGQPADALGPLCRALEEPERREGALRALAKIGPPAVEPLLRIAADPASSAWADDVSRCVGSMGMVAQAEVVRITNATPVVARAALVAIRAASQVSRKARALAIALHARQESPEMKLLAASVVVRSAGDPESAVPAAVTVLLRGSMDDAKLGAAILELAGEEGIEALRSVLPRVDGERVALLVPAVRGLGLAAASLGDELVVAWARTGGDAEEAIVRVAMERFPERASVAMLSRVLRLGPAEYQTSALSRLFSSRPEGPAAVLQSLGALSAHHRSEAERNLRSWGLDVRAIVRAAGRPTLDALAFAEGEKEYAAAMVPELLRDASLPREAIANPETWWPAAARVLATVPETTARELATAVATLEDPMLTALARTVAERFTGVETLLAEVPRLLDRPAVEAAAATFLRALRYHYRWRWQSATRGGALARALADVRSPSGRTLAKSVARELELDAMGRIRWTLDALGAAGRILVTVGAAIAALGLGPLRFPRFVARLRWKLLPGLLFGAGVGVLVARYAFPVPLWRGAIVGIVAGAAALSGALGSFAALATVYKYYDERAQHIVAGVLAAAALVFVPAVLWGNRVAPSAYGAWEVWAGLGAIVAVIGAAYGAIDWRD
jgi:hypothetical protein